jgi:hypothetical protein
MGKSRSGRKAWRGIDASAVEDAVATAASRAKSGAHVASLPDAALFFVDATAAAGARPVGGSARGSGHGISRRSRQAVACSRAAPRSRFARLPAVHVGCVAKPLC